MKEPNIMIIIIIRRRTHELDEFGKVLGTLGELLSVFYIYARERGYMMHPSFCVHLRG